MPVAREPESLRRIAEARAALREERGVPIDGVGWSTRRALIGSPSARARPSAASASSAITSSCWDFLHHFDPPIKVRLLRRVRAAMHPGGLVATIEFVPNDDRVSPPLAAAFSLTMLGSTPAGDAYPFREIERMFADAGFGESRVHPLDPTPQQLVLTRA